VLSFGDVDEIMAAPPARTFDDDIIVITSSPDAHPPALPPRDLEPDLVPPRKTPLEEGDIEVPLRESALAARLAHSLLSATAVPAGRLMAALEPPEEEDAGTSSGDSSGKTFFALVGPTHVVYSGVQPLVLLVGCRRGNGARQRDSARRNRT
jgi:hypothetical protein